MAMPVYLRARVNPARAGMIPCVRPGRRRPPRKPRASGDDPRAAMIWVDAGAVNPARAGMIPGLLAKAMSGLK